jgi:hypothetical protein
MNATAEGLAPGSARDLVPLWFGLLGPPVIWAIRIAASYLLVPYACWWGWVPGLHLATALAVAATAVAGLVAWRRWRAVGRGRDTDLGGWSTRTRFMALGGMLSSGIFIIVIAAEGIANIVIDPCLMGGGRMQM